MRLRPDVVFAPLDDEVVAFSEETQRLVGLNSSAALVLRRLQANVPVGVIEGELTSKGVGIPSLAAEWVAATLKAAGTHGLLAGSPPAEDMVPAYPAQFQDRRVLDMPPLRPFEQVAEHRYKLLNTCALIRFSLPRQMDWVDSAIGHLKTQEPIQETLVLDIQNVPRGGERFGAYIYTNGAGAAIADRLVGLGPTVKGLLWQSAINDSNLAFYLHAGVVGMGDRCILLPGAPGSGKSSLTIALTNRGFRYFSDEAALLEAGTLQVSPLPLAICVKRSGWEAIAPFRPDIRTRLVHFRSDGKHVRYLPPPIGPDQAKAAVSHIIFPRYSPTGPTGLTPMGRCEALQRLMEECLAIPQKLDQGSVEQLVRWIAGIGCYTLRYSSLNEATDLVSEVVRP